MHFAPDFVFPNSLRHLGLVALWALALGMGACKGPAATSQQKLALSPATLLDATTAQNQQAEYLSFKGKADFYDGKKSQKFVLNGRMQRDTIVWASASLLGIEGGRVLLTPDSLRLRNSVEKKYLAQPLSFLRDLVGLDLPLDGLQAVLLGNTFFPVRPQFRTDSAGLAWFTALYQQLDIDWGIDPQTRKIHKLHIQAAKMGLDTWITYTAFQPRGGVLMPTEVRIEALQPTAASLSISYSSLEAHATPLTFPFSIPSDFKSYF
jgi:outer membrane biogenesis lipoprotein LolB